jgi:hypothetical protein
MKESGENSLSVERERKVQQLAKVRRDIENHQKRKHHGLPATTCHRCLNYQQDIVNLEDLISRYDAMLGES